MKNLDTSKYHLGEIPSPVLGRVDWQDWLRNHYPDSVNETCGMHVHMSFGLALYYMKCMNPSLPATIVEYMIRWAGDVKLSDTHPIWPRLRGESRYCQHIYSAEDQILANAKDYDQSRPGHRYTVMHYAYNRTGTVECRLLPMMETPDLAISAINELLTITDAFLVATATKEKKTTATMTADEKGTQRVRQIYIP